MDTIRSQLAVKNQCEHMKKSIKELYDWEEQIKKPALAVSQPVESTSLPPVRSSASAMNEFYKNRKTAEKLDRMDEAVDQMQLADAEVLKDRGNKQCKLGNYRDAIKLYSEAIEIYEDNPVYYSNRALCYMNIELYENCLADCSIALQKDPKNVKAYYRRMQAYERLGENAKAISECRKILNISQDDNERNVTKRDMARIEKRLAEQQAAWTGKEKESVVGTEKDSTLSLVKQEADKYKELGNKFLAKKEFQKAETCYTRAISMFENEAIFYTNRSICYWHLKDYEKCLADCNKAIMLDESYFRPYYRRMLVREHLGSFQGAIEDCKKFLELTKDDKQKATAMKDLLRLEKLMKSEKPAKQAIVWSEVKKNAKPTKFIQKPPHLRSKVALKRIVIEDINQNPVMAPVSSGISVKREPVPDAIIDKIFNNNTGEQLMEPEESTILEHLFPVHSNKLKNLFSSSKTQSDPKQPLSSSIPNIKESVSDTKTLIDSPTNDKVECDKLYQETQVAKAKSFISPTNSLLSIPNSIGQFYTTWSGLNEELKYLYLKLLKDVPLNKLFGAGLSNEMLGELLYVMQTRFIPDKIDVTNIMLEIAKNECVNILSLLLNCNDRKAIKELLKYMETQNASEKDIQQIRTKLFRD
ncbi:RNA polymerase II-associated protein 3-like isoform X2 [Anopheles cruzii]|uniref:RNA polymerase II-associated protein 3-like isoform X2 n=1 Tax=Anopheles cruzii TaxID=68878 RepID=UPI0022EC3A00|nr:RNA polymerase II-associated protein 3-like isoform X2 [Anopheles cruzii]